MATHRDPVVCAKCFEDEGIRAFIRDTAIAKKCSYCGRRSKEPIAAPITEVVDLIKEGIDYEYEDPAEHNPPMRINGGPAPSLRAIRPSRSRSRSTGSQRWSASP